MKKKKILTGLLLVSMAALAFTACGKKTTKTNKTGDNTKVTTKATTQKKTTEKKTTTQEIASTKKCYLNANDGVIVKVDTEKGYLVNATVVLGFSQALMVKPIIKYGKIDSALFITNAAPEKTAAMTNSLTLKPSNKFAPVAWTYSEEFGYDTSFYTTAKVSNDKIEFKAQGKTYSITKDGVIDSSFSEITAPLELKGYTLTYNNEVLNAKDDLDGSNYNISLKKDLFKFDTGDYISQIEWINNKAVLSGAHMEDTKMVKHEERVFSFDNNYRINGSSSIVGGMKVDGEVSWSTDGKVLTIVSASTPYSGGYVYPLASIGIKSKAVLTYDDYGRIIDSKTYMIDDNTEELMTEYNYAFDDNGNVTTETYLPAYNSKQQRKYTYINGVLSKVERQEYVSEEFVTTSYYTITISKEGLATALKEYSVSGSTETLLEECYSEYDEKYRTLEYSKLYYSGGKLANGSYKYTYEYDDDHDIETKTDYAIKSDKLGLYIKSVTATTHETGTTDEKKYKKQISDVIEYDETGEETNREERIATLYEDSAIGYTYEVRTFIASLDEYKTTKSELYDNYHDENILYRETWSYSNSGVLQRYYEETFKLVDGESEIIRTSEEVYYTSGSRSKINEYYYDTEAIEEIIPTKQQMKYESYLFNESNELIHYSIRVYYYVDNNRYEKSIETRDWNESVHGYIDRSAIYTHTHFIGEKQIEEVKILNSSFQLQEDMMYDYLYDEDTNEYTRQVSIYSSYLEQYELNSVELYTGTDYSNIHDEDFIMIIEFVYTGGTDNWLCRMIEYKYNDQGNVIEAFTTEYEKSGAESNYGKSVITYDTDGETQLKETVYASNTTKNDLVKIAEYVSIGDSTYTTFIGLIDENNYYEDLGLGTINSDGRYEKVVHLTFNANTYVIASAILYENDLSDIEHIKSQKWLLNNAELQVEFTDEIIDSLFDTSNYAKDGDPEFKYRQL